MMPKVYTILLFLAFGFIFAPDAGAQCTSFSGSLSSTLPQTLCAQVSFAVNGTGNPVLDGDDVLLYVAYTGAAPNASNVLATSVSGVFPYQAAFLNAGNFNVAVAVGNNAGGGVIDWNDPCLSVSAPASISYHPVPVVDLQDDTLTCIQPSIVLGFSGGSGLTYTWQNGLHTNQIVANIPGFYCVTATNAFGCSATDCAQISENVVPPVANAGPDQTLNCQGLATLQPVITPNTPQYIYTWTGGPAQFTSNLLHPIVSVPGVYILMVTDAVNGCTSSATVSVLGPGPVPLVISIVTQSSGCNGQLSLDPFVAGGIPPYTYQWAGPNGFTSAQKKITVTPPGTYHLTVVDAGGCSQVQSFTVAGYTPINLDLHLYLSACGESVLQGIASGGTAPYLYNWSTTANTAVIQPFSDGVYALSVTDANGCTAQDTLVVQGIGTGGGGCGSISGYVRFDSLANCQNNLEPGLAGWLVAAIGQDTFYGATDANGHFVIGVLPGAYTLKCFPPNALWAPCPQSPQAVVTASGQTVTAPDLLVKALSECPALRVELGTSLLRRCFPSAYTIFYANEGSARADSAFIVIQLDTFLTPLNASANYTLLGPHTLRFNLDTLYPGQLGSIHLNVEVSCNAILGQTHCSSAHIYPDSSCIGPNANWSGALLQVTSHCNGDSLHFVLKNIGLEDLTESVKYIVIEDHVMVLDQAINFLAAGDSVVVTVPANGATWYFQAQQVAYAPVHSQPVAAVEGCTSQPNFTTGIVGLYPDGDADPWFDLDCTANQGSYDPNDKLGIPFGYDIKHYIRPGAEIEYRIRFQNTGTDTAFNILVVDTLSSLLDPATFVPGPASHRYTYDLFGNGVLRFQFSDIQLPDSNKNEAASHGFVKFRIKPRANLPLGSEITNEASIYFDFNEPIITNRTWHTIQENFVQTGVWQIKDPTVQIAVMPNPFSEGAIIHIQGMKNAQPLQLNVYDLKGSLVHSAQVPAASFVLKRNGLRAGVYLIRLTQDGLELGSGKVLIED